MKRLGRWVLNAMTALSLLLCLAVAAVWARSHWRYDWVKYGDVDGRDWVVVATPRGGLAVVVGRADQRGPREAISSGLWHRSYDPGEAVPPAHRFLGVGWEQQANLSIWPVRTTQVAVHDGYLLALFAVLPAVRLYRRLRRRIRFPPGHCHKCGYDLCATPDRCPECGAVPSATVGG